MSATRLAGVLEAIDTVISSCVLCGQPRGDSPSDDFCSEECQWLWEQAQLADPGGANRAALAVAVELRHPKYKVHEKDWTWWRVNVLSRPRDCPHCGSLLALVETSETWGWLALGDPYERKPGLWSLRSTWHTPDRCRETDYSRDQSALFQ